MTLSLTYDDAEARVLINTDWLTDEPDSVIIERSTDEMHWTTVRGAVALAGSLGGVTGYSDYEFDPCIENFYRVSVTPPGLYVTGSGYASTPDHATLDITGQVDLRVAFLAESLASGAIQALISKGTTIGNQRSYWLEISSSGFLRFSWSTDGTFAGALAATSSVVIPADATMVRVVFNPNNGANRTATFQYGTYEGSLFLSEGAIFTTLGTMVTDATTTIFSGSGPLTVGIRDSNADPFNGVIMQAVVINASSTVVANARFDLLTTGTTAFNDGSGLPWTVTSPAVVSTFETESITPELTQVWIKSVTRPFLNRPLATACTSAMGESDTELLVTDTVTRPGRASVFPVINRTMPVGVTDLSLGRSWQFRARTWTLDAHRLMDYLFAAGDVLFIQVPCGDCAQTVENGYVVAYGATYRRHKRYRNRVVWEVPVEEVATPGPDIAYHEATWATVLAQYGTWQDVIDANPTWAHVLALLPDPSEVIVA